MSSERARERQLYETLKIRIWRKYGEDVRALTAKKKQDLQALKIVQELANEVYRKRNNNI